MLPISPTLDAFAVSRSAADDFHHAVCGGLGQLHPSGLQNRLRRTHNRRLADRMKRGKK